MAKDTPEVEPLAGVAPVTALTLPCTALDLYNWVIGLQALRSGAHRLSNALQPDGSPPRLT